MRKEESIEQYIWHRRLRSIGAQAHSVERRAEVIAEQWRHQNTTIYSIPRARYLFEKSGRSISLGTADSHGSLSAGHNLTSIYIYGIL